MSTSHLDRKELKRPDAFQERASSTLEFFSKNARALIVAALGLLAVAAGVALYSNSKSNQNAAANSAFFLVRKPLVTALEKAPKDATWEQSVKEDLGKVEAFAKDHKGTQASFEALLLVGDAYFDHGNYAKASEYYKQALDGGLSRSMKALAQHSLAYAHENAKQNDQAIESLKQVIASGEKSLKGDSLMALARNFAAKGDKAKATEYYEQVTKDFPNSALAKTAEAQKLTLGQAK